VQVYPRVAGGILCDTWSSHVWSAKCLPSRFGAGICGAGALLFSRCNIVCRSFVGARGSGCQSFDSSLCFISAKCDSYFSKIFLIYRAHAVCFCTLVAILNPPDIFFPIALLSSSPQT
jgi:hypothetical protein